MLVLSLRRRWKMFGQITELQINRDVKVVAAVDGLMVSIEFLVSGEPDIGAIKLSRAEAIRVGGDFVKNHSSDRIPQIHFEAADAATFGTWLMRFAGHE